MQWRDVPGSKGKYRISNHGEIIDTKSGSPVKIGKRQHVRLDCGDHKQWWRIDILTRSVFGDDACVPIKKSAKPNLHSAVKPNVADLPEQFNFEEARALEKEKQEEWEFLKLHILGRDKNQCQRCESHSSLEIHHIRPRGLGGSNNPENLITLCRKCHDVVELKVLRNIGLIRNCEL